MIISRYDPQFWNDAGVLAMSVVLFGVSAQAAHRTNVRAREITGMLTPIDRKRLGRDRLRRLNAFVPWLTSIFFALLALFEAYRIIR